MIVSMATQVERTASARRRLMQAAIELFAEQGVRGASVAAIGARAGMSRGAVNFHFGSKEQLLNALSVRFVADWEEGMLEPALANSTDLSGAIDAALDAHRRSLTEMPERFALYQSLLFESIGPTPQIRQALIEMQRKVRMAIINFIDQAAARDAFPRPIHSQGAAVWMLATLRGIAEQYLLERDELELDEAYDELRRALGAYFGLPNRRRRDDDPLAPAPTRSA
jgi:AcrR family transcriptional regulator